MSLEIRDVRRSDLRSIMTIDAAVYPKPWSKRLWTQELDRPHRAYRCAVADGSIVGVSGVLFAGDDAHIMTIAVAPARQRQGVGTALLVDAAHRAIDAGAGALTLEVRAGNTGAQALYTRFGFEVAGVRRGYYEPDGEDAVVMWAKDIAGPAFSQRLGLLAPGEAEERV